MAQQLTLYNPIDTAMDLTMIIGKKLTLKRNRLPLMRMPSPNFSAPLLKKRNFSYQRNGIRENYIKGFYNNSIPMPHTR